MKVFGRSTANALSRRQAETIAHFLRNEPLWPLFVAIVKLRRSPPILSVSPAHPEDTKYG